MITILILISRSTWLDRIFATLEMLECDSANINIIGIIDGDNELFVTARNKVMQSKFNNRLCIPFKSEDKLLNANIAHRQQRIANIHNFAKQHIQSAEYIFGLEDDSTFSVLALKQLQHDYSLYPYAGMISGAEVGRHGITHIGAWRLDSIYEPKLITSVDKVKGIREVDATGMYCFLTKAKNYLDHTFEPYENTLGPDFQWGLTMRQSGLMNYIDFDVPIIHNTKDGELTTKGKIDTVSFIKNEMGRWRQKTS